MRRVLVVGEAPGPRGGPPLQGACGARLGALIGVSCITLAADVVNLLPRWPGPVGKGSGFPLMEAAAHACFLDVSKHEVVLLLGKRVAQAFLHNGEYLEWFDLRGTPAAVIPHPSGVNRWWNDPRRVAAARSFMQEVFDGDR